jgi:hypothetical protein
VRLLGSIEQKASTSDLEQLQVELAQAQMEFARVQSELACGFKPSR